MPKPENPQSLNRFTYVRNNPLRYIDPLGFQGEVTEEEISSWGYDPTLTSWLIELLKGAKAMGTDSVCWELLRFVRDQRPNIVWATEASFLGYKMSVSGGLTVPNTFLRGHTIYLNPNLPNDHDILYDTAILAHELGHAIADMRGVASMEEEYWCNRVQGSAYMEMLVAGGTAREEAETVAQQQYTALGVDLAQRDTWIRNAWQDPQRNRNCWWMHEYRGELNAGFLWFFGAFSPLGYPDWVARRYEGVWR